MLVFQTLYNQKILPQFSNIIADIKRVKIGNDGVAYSVIKKVIFTFRSDFFPAIAAESTQIDKDKRFSNKSRYRATVLLSIPSCLPNSESDTSLPT